MNDPQPPAPEASDVIAQIAEEVDSIEFHAPEALPSGRWGAIVLAADAATRYPEDREAFGRLSQLCERVTDAELDNIRALAGKDAAG